MATMKRSVFMLLTLLLLLLGCSRSDVTPDVVQGKLMLKLSNPGTYAVSDESDINELHVLFFDSNGNFIVCNEASKVEGLNQYEVVAPIKTGMTLLIVANGGSNISSQFTSVADVIENLIYHISFETLNSSMDYIPMFCKKTNVNVSATAPQTFNSISLTRSLAKVEVVNSASASGFNLNEVYVVNASKKGLVAGGENGSGNFISGVDRVDRAMSTSAFYLFECDNSGSNSDSWTKLVVVGSYYGQSYYYPIFFKGDDDRYSSVVRNYHYKFIITKVSGPGYSSLAEAKVSRPINFTVEVTSWTSSAKQIFKDEFYEVALTSSSFTLGGGKGASASVGITTDTDISLWTYAVANTTNPPNEDSFKVLNQIYDDDFSFATSNVSGDKSTGTLTVTAKGKATTSINRFLFVRAKTLSFYLPISQLADTPHDWDDEGLVENPRGAQPSIVVKLDGSPVAGSSLVRPENKAEVLTFSVLLSNVLATYSVSLSSTNGFTLGSPNSNIAHSGSFTVSLAKNTDRERFTFVTITSGSTKRVFKLVQPGVQGADRKNEDWTEGEKFDISM
jgi:hypothetical protein